MQSILEAVGGALSYRISIDMVMNKMITPPISGSTRNVGIHITADRLISILGASVTQISTLPVDQFATAELVIPRPDSLGSKLAKEGGSMSQLNRQKSITLYQQQEADSLDMTLVDTTSAKRAREQHASVSFRREKAVLDTHASVVSYSSSMRRRPRRAV